MTKEQFLTILKEKLLPHMNYSELLNALEYYNDYIEDGKLEKDEATVIEELGDIDQLANGLLENFKNLDLDYIQEQVITQEQAYTSSLIKVRVKDFPLEVYYDHTDTVQFEINDEYQGYFSYNHNEEGYFLEQIHSLHLTGLFNIIDPIQIHIPMALVVKLDLETKNNKIVVEGQRTITNGIKAKSTNGSVIIQSLQGEFDLKTENGKIVIDHCSGKKVEAKTTNSKISIVQSEYIELSARTTNGSIMIEDSTINKCKAKTTNANVKVNTSNISDLEVKTSNGNILVEDCSEDIQIHYETSNGSVSLFDQKYSQKGTSYFQAGSNHYELITSNGRIVVKS